MKSVFINSKGCDHVRLPLAYPMNELMPFSLLALPSFQMANRQPLYPIAMTAAELPRKGPRRVIPLRMAFSLIREGAPGGARLSPSAKPQAPPKTFQHGNKAIQQVCPTRRQGKQICAPSSVTQVVGPAAAGYRRLAAGKVGEYGVVDGEVFELVGRAC
jgi:hypothetical protein